MHKTTIEENSRYVDQIESLQKLLGEAQEEILILKHRKNIHRQPSSGGGGEQQHLLSPSPTTSSGSSSMQQSAGGGTTTTTTATGIKSTSALLSAGGIVPGACPMGGCSHYESVTRGSDVMKNFQNHMNNTHRVGIFFVSYKYTYAVFFCI
jgi:hypothetical protein